MTRKPQRRYVDYETPPVIEVVCGVVFQPIQEFSAAWFGLLWSRFGEKFTGTQDRPALPMPMPMPPGQVRIDLTPGVELPRVWFTTEDSTRLVQVQKNRFHFNWQKSEVGEEYPGFIAIHEEFKRHLGAFEEFLSEQGVAKPQFTQFELTYVNRIPVDGVWSGFQQVGRVLTDLSWRDQEDRFLPPPEQMAWEAGFPMPGGAGVLSVRARSVRRRDTGEPALALDLTASGPSSGEDIDHWFDIGHQWIVRGFTDLTGPEMHKRTWKRRDDPK